MEGLEKLWRLQEQQQKELGLDPDNMSDVERSVAFSHFLNQLHEEAAAIGRGNPVYKRHLLLDNQGRGGVVEGCVAVVKMAFAIAQLEGFDYDHFRTAFEEETERVQQVAYQARSRLEKDTLVLGFDCDDVLADLGPFRERLRAGGTENNSFAAALAANEGLKQHFYRDGGFRELAPVPGASEAMLRIRARYNPVNVVITARPQWRYKRLYADTAWWLRQNSIPFHRILFNRNKVEAIHEHILPAWPRIFVEDHLKNARDLVDAGVDVLLFDQPHNRVPDAPGERVFGWEGVEKALERRLG